MRRSLALRRALRIALVAVLLLATGLAVARAAFASATPPRGDTRPVAAFIGDAYAKGVGATSSAARWTAIVSREEGWREVNFARAHTGYASSSPASVCGQAICPPFADWVDAVAAVDPAVVVVAGGQGDWLAWQSDADRTAGLIDTTLDTLQKRMPSARIIVVSPLQPPGADHAATVDEIAAQVKSSAEERDLTYVDLLQPNVLSEGTDVAADRFNASDAGHRAIADRVVQALR